MCCLGQAGCLCPRLARLAVWPINKIDTCQGWSCCCLGHADRVLVEVVTYLQAHARRLPGVSLP